MTDGMLLREFLGEPDLAGYRYVQQTFQCLQRERLVLTPNIIDCSSCIELKLALLATFQVTVPYIQCLDSISSEN